jgi:H+/Cl- antiporter ClcA
MFSKFWISRGELEEESVIFFSVFRWLLLAVIIGILVGTATAGFLWCLQWSSRISAWPYYFWLLPIAMFGSIMLIKYIAPDAKGHGTEKVIEAVHKHSGKIKAIVVPVKLVATVMTLATGGSVGKEGPSAQIGAGLSSIFSDIFKLVDRDRKKLVICGISAGFAAVFGTPIAGSVFGIEVLFVGAILYDVLLPSFVAGIVAYQVASYWGITYLHQGIDLTPVFSNLFFLYILLAGIFFGLVSFLTIKTLQWTEDLAQSIRIWEPLKGLIGGIALVLLTYSFSKNFLGLGLDSIKSVLEGHPIIWYAFAMKIIFTSITLSFGGSGGIATPLFFIGATAGALFAQVFGLNVATFAAIGFVSVLGGAANAPLAASIMSIEMFGPKLASFAAIACVISYLITGHRSVYPSQVLSIRKSVYINIELGKKLDELDNEFRAERVNHPFNRREIQKRIKRTFGKL